MRFERLCILILVVLMFMGCSGSDTPTTPPLSSYKAITAFDFTSSVSPGVVTESNYTIAITVQYGTVLTALVPTIAHTGASINPASGAAQNFTSPVNYTVTAADNSTQIYTVTVYTVVPLFKTMATTSYGTGDDGDLELGTAWPSTRFTANTANTMTDSLTGLVWIKSPDSTGRTWANALTYADTFEVDGITDWRLPNINELENMIHSGIAYPSMPYDWLNANGFSNILVGSYWTSTTYAGDTNSVWYIENSMRIGKTLKTNPVLYTWLVTGTASNIAKTGQTTSYAAGDDGDLEKGCSIPASDRFVVIGNTIKDKITGLIWEKTPVISTRSWANALTYADTLVIDGFTDWRLPNKKELRSLMNYEQANLITYLTAAGFSNLQSALYWTSTYYESSGMNKAYAVDFGNVATIGIGAVLNNTWTSPIYVIAVRGGN
jgi:hypothetical protein